MYSFGIGPAPDLKHFEPQQSEEAPLPVVITPEQAPEPDIEVRDGVAKRPSPLQTSRKTPGSRS